VQCANTACNAIHKIVDNLNLIEEINYKEEEEKRKREEEEGRERGRRRGGRRGKWLGLDQKSGTR